MLCVPRLARLMFREVRVAYLRGLINRFKSKMESDALILLLTLYRPASEKTQYLICRFFLQSVLGVLFVQNNLYLQVTVSENILFYGSFIAIS